MEFFEDCEKNEEKLVAENSSFRGEFGDSKIVEPTNGGDRQIQKVFLIDFDIWNVKIRVRMRKLWLFYERTPN